MARLSKSKAFAIYEDNRIQAVEARLSENGDIGSTGDVDETEHEIGVTQHEEEYESTSIIDYAPQEQFVDGEAQDQYAEDADDERRESAVTSTSISSFPDSYYMTENDDALNIYATYTPPIIRTRFRRPESVRRMQMSSPPPYGYRSPRQSILSHSRSRTGTPRSVRSVNRRGSPKSKKDGSKEDDDVEPQHYPLVLLHVSLLPLNAPWSIEGMQDLLPRNVIENLQLLRSKLSDTVLQRGVLIPHPKEEYELLEERLLETLELKEERLTKCGHFSHQLSRSSEASNATSERGSDSGIGSSADGSDEELCAICQSHIKQSKTGVGPRSGKWMIKVYAANGLMRSAAWTAAWSDMERVDVEIAPFISDDVRRKLDERSAQEEAAKQDWMDDEESRIRRIVEEHVELVLEQRLATLVTPQQQHSPAPSEPYQPVIPESMRLEPPAPSPQNDLTQSFNPQDLPAIYRPSQIPISILLKNYVYLLAQDRRNLVVLGLSIAMVFLATAFGSRTDQTTLTPSNTSPVKDIPMAATASSSTIMPPNPSRLSSEEVDKATFDPSQPEAATLVEDALVDSAFYDSKLGSDVVESGVDTSGDMSYPWTQLRNPGDVMHLDLDETARWSYDMCPA